MDFSSLLAQAKQALSVIENPSQSAVVAGGLAGSFSAEINNLTQSAAVDLQDFGVKIPAPLQGIFKSISTPIQSFLRPSPTANPVSSTLSTVALVLVGALAAAFLVGRRS